MARKLGTELKSMGGSKVKAASTTKAKAVTKPVVRATKKK